MLSCKEKLPLLLAIIFLGCFKEGASSDDFYYMKACFPWFRPPEPKNNCTLRCSLSMPYLGISHKEVAICLSDGMTGITCQGDADCQMLLEGSYCKRASCLCEEKGLDRFYGLGGIPDASLSFCAASSEIHSIHLPLVLFPWKTLMIVFGTLVFTGLLLMTMKWLSPIISTLREYHGSDTRTRTGDLLPSEPRRVIVQDKPPPYETAVQLNDVLPSYEDAQRLPTVPLNTVVENIQASQQQQPQEPASSSESHQPLLPPTGASTSIVTNTTTSLQTNPNSAT